MKGIVFTEFIDWADNQFTPETVEQVIEECELPSGGIYTAVGTYYHGELIQLVMHLSEHVRTQPAVLVRDFGKHLFRRFYEGYPHFFKDVGSTFDFLVNVEEYIHVEVLKLYPDAQLPRFNYRRVDDDSLELEYYSSRPFADLAEGLILGCIEHFGESICVKREDIGTTAGSAVCFSLRCTSGVLQCK